MGRMQRGSFGSDRSHCYAVRPHSLWRAQSPYSQYQIGQRYTVRCERVSAYGCGPESQAPASRAACDASAVTGAPTPAKCWFSWSWLSASWSGGGTFLELVAVKYAPYCLSRLQKTQRITVGKYVCTYLGVVI